MSTMGIDQQIHARFHVSRVECDREKENAFDISFIFHKNESSTHRFSLHNKRVNKSTKRL